MKPIHKRRPLHPYLDWQLCNIKATNVLGGKDDHEIELDDGSKSYF